MALSPLPANNTDRFKLTYFDGYHNHSLVCRTADVGFGTVNTALDGFLTAIEGLLGLITIIGLELAEAGSDVFNPSVWSGAATYGAGTLSAINRPFSLSFTGRASSGRKARVFIFGVDSPTDDTWRFTTSESGFVNDAVAALTAVGGTFLAIDALTPTWHPYANFGANDHWVKVIRGGG